MGDSLEILPRTVREILNLDNDGIISLCKAGDIPLRQNNRGLTYFTTDDVKTLKRIQEVQNKTKFHEEKSIKLKNGLKKLPAKKVENKIETVPEKPKNDEAVVLLKQITGAVKNIENGIYDKFSTLLEDKLENKLEEKLGGIDEVIMDLVRCKAEAEDMRKTIATNNKEIYSLKNELSGFKHVLGNIYVRKEVDDEFEV